MNKKHVVVYSHGFGVRKDDRGLFVDIAESLPQVESFMFDYNMVLEEGKVMYVSPFSKQAALLCANVHKIQEQNPGVIIDLVCHSQGSVIAAIAQCAGVRKTVLLAPPDSLDTSRILDRYKDNPETVIDTGGLTSIPRSDGTTTHIPKEYFSESDQSRAPEELYNALADTTDLTIVQAEDDHVLGEVVFENLHQSIECLTLEGDHDFSGSSRSVLVQQVRTILGNH